MEAWLSTYVEHLRALPFVRRVQTRRPSRRVGHAPLELVISTPLGKHCLRAEEKRSHLGRALLGDVVSRLGNAKTPWLLLAPYVSRPTAARLVEKGIAFVDRVGNCHLDLGGAFVAHVTGRRPASEQTRRGGFRAPAYRVLFLFLADPTRVASPMRHVAALAEVGVGTVANVMARLREERFVVDTRSGPRLVASEALLDRWVSAYADVLRPHLLQGRFELPAGNRRNPEAWIEQALGDRQAWAFGGSAGAYQLTRHYRGEETVLHVSEAPTDLARRLRALPHRDGTLIVVRAPLPRALEGPRARVAHPLLIYAELLHTGTSRALETARDVRREYLKLP